MMANLPHGAGKALIDRRDSFLKRELPIVERLITERNQNFISAMHSVENAFSTFSNLNTLSERTVYPDPMLGQWECFLRSIMFCLTEFNHSTVRGTKDAQLELSDTLNEIHKAAKNLATKLRIASLRCENYGFYAEYDISGDSLLINAAENSSDSEKKHRFKSWLKPEMEKLSDRFDSKYWPTVIEIIDELSRQTSEIEVTLIRGELPKQIHTDNAFLQNFFERIFSDVDRGMISPELFNLKNSEWCGILNTASGSHHIYDQRIKKYTSEGKSLFL